MASGLRGIVPPRDSVAAIARSAARLPSAASVALLAACEPEVQGNGVYREERRNPAREFMGLRSRTA